MLGIFIEMGARIIMDFGVLVVYSGRKPPTTEILVFDTLYNSYLQKSKKQKKKKKKKSNKTTNMLFGV